MAPYLSRQTPLTSSHKTLPYGVLNLHSTGWFCSCNHFFRALTIFTCLAPCLFGEKRIDIYRMLRVLDDRKKTCRGEEKPGIDVLYTGCVAPSLIVPPAPAYRHSRLQPWVKELFYSSAAFLSWFGARRNNLNRYLSARRKGQT